MLSSGELSTLMSAQLKRGVFTNSTMSAAAYLEDDPKLEAVVLDGALLLLRHRPGFFLLNYYVQQGCESLEIPSLDGLPVVCETAYRQKDSAAANRAMDLLKGAGFEPCLERIRLGGNGGKLSDLCMDKGGQPGPCVDKSSKSALCADKSSAPGLCADNGAVISPVYVEPFSPEYTAFLREHFSSFTGCIPPENLLAKDKFAVSRSDGKITGLLHFSVSRSFWEIHHLAVVPEFRGSGLAALLLETAQKNTDAAMNASAAKNVSAAASLRCRVWTGADNRAALRFYEKHSFTADGYQSAVLIRK